MATVGSEMFNPIKVAAESFQSAMEAGLKFQKEAVSIFSEATTRGNGLEETRRRIETLANDSLETLRKNTEQTQKMFEEVSRTGIDLLRKSVETAGDAQGRGEGLFKRTQDLWQNTLDAWRASAESLAKANTQMIENWSSFMNRALGISEKKAAASK